MQVVEMKTVNGPDKAKIKQVTDASHTATVAMVALGFRERAGAYTNLASFKTQLLRMNEKVVDKDYMEFWRGLEAAGAGSIILGRRGGQTRFEWRYSLKQIAQLAIEGKEVEVERLESKFKHGETESFEEAVKRLQPKPAPVLPLTRSNMIIRTVKLRPDCTIQIVLPNDITAMELLKITSALVG